VGGLLNTTALASFCAGTNCYLVTWKDAGFLGSSADASQSTAASQPQVVASGVVETQNGVPTVYFGSSAYLTFGGAGPYTNNSFFGVAQPVNASNPVLFSGAAGSFQISVNSLKVVMGSAAVANFPTSTYTMSTTLSVISGFYTPGGSNNSTNVNGNSFSFSASTAFSAGVSFIGRYGPLATFYWNSNISELVYFGVFLSSSDENTLRLNEENSFGISGT
jgi:hypothetical protein